MPSNPAAAVRVGSRRGKWHATPCVRLNPCPVWGFTAVVPLSTSDLSPSSGDAGSLELPVWVKVYSVGDDGNDSPLGSINLSFPLSMDLAAAVEAGASEAMGLDPPVQVLSYYRPTP